MSVYMQQMLLNAYAIVAIMHFPSYIVHADLYEMKLSYECVSPI